LLSAPSHAAPIHEAIQAGDLNKVRQLLDAGGNVNDMTDAQYSPLQIAAQQGKNEIAKLLLERGADINMDESGNGSALRLAAIGGHFEIIELLLDRGAESSDPMEAATLLVHAVSQGDLALVNKLLLRKINLDAEPLNPEPYDHSENALHTAIDLNRADIIELLIKNGASIRPDDLIQVVCTKNLGLVKLFLSRGEKAGNSVLARAVGCGNKEVLGYLMASAGPLDYAGIVQYFPSYDYSGSGVSGISRELFEILFAGDADLKSHAAPALTNALVTGNHKLLTLLLDKGVPMPQENAEGNLFSAAQNGHAEIVDILLKRGTQVDIRTEWGNTPLLRAVPYNQIKVAALLLQNGANVNAKNELFNTPLHMASARDFSEIADLLIKQGARVNAINGDGNTPLHQAARFPGKFIALKLLLTQKINVNIQNKRGMTALHYLAIRNTDYKDYDEMVGARGYADPDDLQYWQRPSEDQANDEERANAIKLLIGYGADPNIKNLRGESALDLERKYSRNTELVRLLEAKAATVKP